MDRFDRVVAGLGYVMGLAIVGYVAVFGDGEIRTVALGAVVGLLGAGGGWYYRGKVQKPDTSDGSSLGAGDDVLLRADGPATATVHSESGLSAGGAVVTGAAPSEK